MSSPYLDDVEKDGRPMSDIWTPVRESGEPRKPLPERPIMDPAVTDYLHDIHSTLTEMCETLNAIRNKLDEQKD
jgi:hypothetical protein